MGLWLFMSAAVRSPCWASVTPISAMTFFQNENCPLPASPWHPPSVFCLYDADPSRPSWEPILQYLSFHDGSFR